MFAPDGKAERDRDKWKKKAELTEGYFIVRRNEHWERSLRGRADKMKLWKRWVGDGSSVDEEWLALHRRRDIPGIEVRSEDQCHSR